MFVDSILFVFLVGVYVFGFLFMLPQLFVNYKVGRKREGILFTVTK